MLSLAILCLLPLWVAAAGNVRLDPSETSIALMAQNVVNRINADGLYDKFMLMTSIMSAVKNEDENRYYIDIRTELGSDDSVRQYEVYDSVPDSGISASVSYILGTAIKNFYTTDVESYTSYDHVWNEVSPERDEVVSAVRVAERRLRGMTIPTVLHAEVRFRNKEAELKGLDRIVERFRPRVLEMREKREELMTALTPLETELENIVDLRTKNYSRQLNVLYETKSAARDQLNYSLNEVEAELSMKEDLVTKTEEFRQQIVAEFEPAAQLPSTAKTFGPRSYLYLVVKATSEGKTVRKELLFYEDRSGTLQLTKHHPYV